MQLLSVSCLSLAAKMEETTVPILLDLQIIKPRFLFKPKTVQRMEVLVMKTLKWRLRTITPFDFLHYFISCINNSQHNSLCHLFSCATGLIINTCKGKLLAGQKKKLELSSIFSFSDPSLCSSFWQQLIPWITLHQQLLQQ